MLLTQNYSFAPMDFRLILHLQSRVAFR